jgi:hypothetical protein
MHAGATSRWRGARRMGPDYEAALGVNATVKRAPSPRPDVGVARESSPMNANACTVQAFAPNANSTPGGPVPGAASTSARRRPKTAPSVQPVHCSLCSCPLVTADTPARRGLSAMARAKRPPGASATPPALPIVLIENPTGELALGSDPAQQITQNAGASNPTLSSAEQTAGDCRRPSRSAPRRGRAPSHRQATGPRPRRVGASPGGHGRPHAYTSAALPTRVLSIPHPLPRTQPAAPRPSSTATRR